MRSASRARTDEIARLLRRAVRERILLPGQALNQDDLAKRFGVSRIPLREALRTLAGEGLVVMRPGIGAVVTELRPEEVSELYELRLQLEPPLAAAIVERCGAQDLAELEGLLARMAGEHGGGEAWANDHYLLHRRLVELCGRRHTLRLLTQVLNLVEPYSRLYVHLSGEAEHSMADHEEIVDALRDRHAGRLEARMRAGLEAARDRLVNSMSGATEQGEAEIDLARLLGPPPGGR